MMNRRLLILTPMLGLLTSGCITDSDGRKPGYSLAQVLQALPSARTGADLIARFGEPNYRETFNHDDPGNEYYVSKQSTHYWKMLFVETPAGLIDRLEPGARILLYNFAAGDPFIPTSGVLLVCIDKSDVIIGLLVDKVFAGHETQAHAQIL